jgi:hypothetical protein
MDLFGRAASIRLWGTRWQALVLCLAVLLLPARRCLAADAEWVKVVGGDSRALVRVAEGSGIYSNHTFMLQMDGVAPDKVQVGRGAVSCDGKDYSTDAGFKPTLTPIKDTSTASLSFAFDKAIAPGKCDVVVVATVKPATNEEEQGKAKDKDTAKPPTPVTLTFHLVSPSAQAHVAPSVYVEGEISWFKIFTGRAAGVGQLNVTETSGSSRLTGVKIALLNGVVIEGRNGAGRVSPAADKGVVEAGASHDFGIKADDFELGTSSATLRVTADQLTQPVDVRLEFRARRGRGAIWLIIAVGLALGILLRQVLVNIAARGKLVEEIDAARDSFSATLASLTDETARTAVQAAIDELETKLPKDAAKARLAIGALEQTVEKAIGTLRTRREETNNEVNALAQLTSYAPELPARMKLALLQGVVGLPAVRALLSQGNVGAAASALQQLTTEVASALSREADGWAKGVQRALSTLSPALRDTPRAGAVDELQPLQQAVDNLLGTSDPEPLLKAVQALRLRLKRYLEEIFLRLVSEIKQAEDSLAAFPAASSVLAALKEHLEKLRSEANGDDGVETVLSRVTDDFAAAWTSMLAAFTPKPGLAAVKHKITRGEYGDAVEVALTAVEDAKKAAAADARSRLLAQGAEKLGSSPAPGTGSPVAAPPAATSPAAVATTEAAVVFSAATGRAPLLDLLDALFLGSTSASLPPILDAASSKRAIVEGKLARMAQLAIVALLLATTGYALYAPTFVGQYSEFFAIFMWAFSANVGIDALLEQSKQVVKGRV